MFTSPFRQARHPFNPSQHMAARAVQNLLDAVQHHKQLDEELMDYICSVLTDPDPESSLEVLQELVAGAVPDFAGRSSEEQTALVLKLLDDAKACDTTEHDHSPSCNSLEAVVAVFRQATIHSQQQGACADISNTVGSTTSKSSSCNDSKQKSDTASLQDLSSLLALSPEGISLQFLAHMLQHTFKGNMQQAADWLLDCPDVLQKQDAWDKQQIEEEQMRQRQEEAKKQVKKQIVERFDLQVVPNCPLKAIHGVDILPAAKKGQQSQGKVRYRDGKVVSCKGEKYIVEKLGEEWDGGSRGKVYTKGKRGVGYR